MNLLSVSEHYYARIYYILLLTIAALLPFTNYFSVQFTNIAIILLFVSWLVLYSKKGLKYLKFRKIILLFLAVYFLYLLSLLRGGSLEVVEKGLLKKVPLLIFPLVIGLSPKINKQQLNYILLAFVISLIIGSFITYFRGISNFVLTPEALTELAYKVIIHRPYFGLFCAFAILFLIFLLFEQKSLFFKILIVLSIAYLLFFIVFIYAKMALLGLLFSVLLLIFILLVYKKKYVYLLSILLFLLLSFLLLYHQSSSVKRYTQTAITNTNNIIQGKGFSYEKYNIMIVGSINVRYINWGCAFTILQENKNWIFGVAAGNAQSRLQDCYKDRNPWVYDNKMNAHNQFIQEALYAGIFGLLLFSLTLIVPAIFAFKENNFLFIAFILIFVFCSITENILERQIGIIFYAIFNSLLFFNTGKESVTTSPEQLV